MTKNLLNIPPIYLALLCASFPSLILPAPTQAAPPPLSLTTRHLPVPPPTREIVFSHPTARTVAIRHEGSAWATDHFLRKEGDHWRISIHDLGWTRGPYEFKFLVNGRWEGDPNRLAYITHQGVLGHPPAVYLTWAADPATSIVIHWHAPTNLPTSRIKIRPKGHAAWQHLEGASTPFPDTPLLIHTVSVQDLQPDTRYEIHIPTLDHTSTFSTLPATLHRPVRFIQGGDVFHHAEPMDRMNRLVGSLDPEFIILGGDLAYADGKTENVWRWHRFFQSFHDHLRAPDGRLIPMVVAIGNHETKRYYIDRYDHVEDSDPWRESIAPYFFHLFATPGQPGYHVLDAGDYLSLILLDTFHANPIEGRQTEWLRSILETRSSRPHIFPVIHVPAFPSVRNFDDPINRMVRDHWVPLFEQHPIRLVFEQHDHAFKVTHPIRNGTVHPEGIVYLGDGAWSVDTRIPATPDERWYLRTSGAHHHVFEITLEPHRRVVRAIDIDGNELDRFEQTLDSE